MHTIVPLWVWLAFHVVVFGVLALDLGLLNRKSTTVSIKGALLWTAFWVLLSLSFCAGIYRFLGPPQAMEFLTAYVVEYALSVDNIFVFIVLFGFFKVPSEHQHKVLFWGVLGAFVMRGLMIVAGSTLIHRFEWLVFPFGAFLVYTGLKLLRAGDETVEPGENAPVRLLRRMMPVTDEYHGSRFFVMENGRRAATPLFAVLLVVESTDLIFAVDSIPAVLAISRDSFIVYTSNICAILGLRSLYFAVNGIMGLFHYLKYGLAAVLVFVGTKMLLSHSPWQIPIAVSLVTIVSFLAISVIASLLRPQKPPASL